MRYAGQVQTAIELLEEQNERRAPVDKLMAGFFRRRRYIGSTDKGVVADILYAVQRRLAELYYILEENSIEVEPRQLVMACLMLEFNRTSKDIKSIFDGEKFNPEKLFRREIEFIANFNAKILNDAPLCVQYNYPQWLESSLKQAFGDDLKVAMEAMNSRASTDIRVNTLTTTPERLQEELAKDGFDMEAGKLSPLCLKMADKKPLFGLESFKRGNFEVQDEGSQLIAALTGVKTGMKVVDFCAGAGGKTLALAAAMKNKGTIYACDINERRMKEMDKRLKRAKVNNVRKYILRDENDKFVKRHNRAIDVVLLDAPCSGTGTWRRSPDSRWNLSPEGVSRLTRIQESILDSTWRMVKKDGFLVYATCSVLKEENEDQVEKFLKKHKDFELVPVTEILPDVDLGGDNKLSNASYMRLMPHIHGCDGFFTAVLRKTS